jgi:DNA-binding IclR family transcriptional regulator
MTAAAESAPEGAVARALSVLEFLVRAGEPTRLSAIAVGLDLQKSTVHRILASLASSGYVQQIKETGCYGPTLKLWELGTAALDQHPIRRAAAGYLQDLHRSTGETVSLLVLADDDVLFLDKLLSPRATKFTTRVGSRIPATMTAGGKAMFAHLPDARLRLDRLAARLKPTRHRFSVTAAMRELEQVRSQGYSLSNYTPGVTSIGAALLGRDSLPTAAISVSAPTDRLSAQKRKSIVDELLSVVVHMSERVRL